MDPSALINRLGISLYSTLTSVMSGFNHLRMKVNEPPGSLDWLPVEDKASMGKISYQGKLKSLWLSRKTIITFVLVLVVWMVLGFAAGFLIGMIKPW